MNVAWLHGVALLGLLGLLCGLPLAAQAQTCSPYVGQVSINELRIGSSNQSASSNQVEIYNSGNVAASVWNTWQLVVYYRSSGGTATKKGGYLLSSGFTASGAFVYNNSKAMFLRNRAGRYTDVALVDSSGRFIDYVAIEGKVQTVPACLGTPKVVDATVSSDTTADIARATDGGAWPATVNQTSSHTIGSSNTCTAGGSDLSVALAADGASSNQAIVGVTTVTYTLTVANKSCSNTVNGIVVSASGISSTNFSGLAYSASQGSTVQGASALAWTIGSLAKGVSAMLTISGKARNVGPLSTTATVTSPASGLLNTGDDSDTETLTVSDYNYVSFDRATDTVTEGTDPTYSAVLSARVMPTARITVSYTVSGSAGNGDTDLPASGTVVIDPVDPETPRATSIDFTIRNDAIREPTKTITLTITGLSSGDALVKLDSAAARMDIELLDDDSAIDHYELAVASSMVSCLPTPVTVTACANNSSPCTSPYAGAAGTTATVAASAGSLAANTVTFDATGLATTTYSHPAASQGTAVTLTLSGEQTAATSARQCCPDGRACAAANSCATTVNTAAFIVAASPGGGATAIPTQTAGTASGTFYLRAVRTNSSTQACEAALTGAASVNWAYQCNDPAVCSASNLMFVNGGSATAVQRNNNAGVTATTPVAMSFDASGNAPFSLTFNDVGRATLWASMTVNASALSGSSNAFVTRPARFALSGLAQTANPQLANPAAADAAGAKFVRAGESFSATVTAQTSAGSATPNYGKEAVPEGVLLSRSLVLPVGGASGTLANATVAGSSFSNGAATVTNLAWSEVGIITLTPSVADGDYLGSGNVSGAVSGNLGRFVPARFALSGASLTQRVALGCSPASGFSYLGEAFRFAFTLTAQNLAGATTQNYSGAFAKLDPANASTWNLAGIDGSTVFSAGNGRLALGSASGSWGNGVASSVALTAAALRGSAPDGPFNAGFGIAPNDSDGVVMASFDLDTDSPANGADHANVGSVALVFGRLRLLSAAGAADRALALPLTAQAWNGNAFADHVADSCTRVPASALSFGNLRRTLIAADAAAGDVSLSAGRGSLRLAAPGGGRRGTYDVAVSLGSGASDASCLQPWVPASGKTATAGTSLAYLRGAWCGSSFDKDPAARASFGLARGADARIYAREHY